MARPGRWLMVVGAVALVGVVSVMVWKLAGTHSVSSQRTYEALHGESKLVTASQDVNVRVTVRDDNVLPDWLSGQKAVVDATGTVEAYFDLSELGPGDVSVDGDAVTIDMPPVHFSQPSIDGLDWRVDERGLIDRVSDVIRSDEDFRGRVITKLNSELQEKGFGSGKLEDAARRNAADAVRPLLRPLAADRVVLAFDDQPTASG